MTEQHEVSSRTDSTAPAARVSTAETDATRLSEVDGLEHARLTGVEDEIQVLPSQIDGGDVSVSAGRKTEGSRTMCIPGSCVVFEETVSMCNCRVGWV